MTDDMQREAFERVMIRDFGWHRSGIDVLSSGSGYEDGELQIAWEGWCAHIRHMREQESTDEPDECPICGKAYFNKRCTGCGYEQEDKA